MTLRQADVLEYYLKHATGAETVQVFDRTCDAVIVYPCARETVIRALAAFSFQKAETMALVPAHTPRELNREFEDKLAMTVLRRAISKLFLPLSVRAVIAMVRSVKYIKESLSALLHGKLSVAVLDATAVTVSMVRGDSDTAGSVMFMLRLGEILEEWTHKKSVADLAGAMSHNVDKVWLKTNGTEVLMPIGDIQAGDRIVVRTGNMIPLDGKVVEGEALVNQASMTGESLPVQKSVGSYVYAGTVAEEGESVICVERAMGGGRYDRIVRMIEESEKLKSTAEDKASRLADKLVPYTLGGTALTYLLTRNVTKMLAVLMVDFSCALKLSMPIAVLSGMKEADIHHNTVKGRRFMEAVAQAAIDHRKAQQRQVDHLREIREQTAAWLKEQTYKGQPLEVAPSQSNFLLFGGHFDDRGAIFDQMLLRGARIRVVGPEGWLRVCMGTDEEMRRFREALVESMRAVENA